jgi:glycosyltransferase involved in cell wall biosynthesis
VRVGLLTDGGYPYADGEARLWCDRLVRGLDTYAFDLYAFSRGSRQERLGWVRLPAHVERVRTAALWDAPEDWPRPGRRVRREALDHFAVLATTACAAAPAPPASAHAPAPALAPVPASTKSPGGLLGLAALAGIAAKDTRRPAAAPAASGTSPFTAALLGLTALAQDHGPLSGLLRSEAAVRVLEHACRAPRAVPAARRARVPDLLLIADLIERALRPLALDWYDADGLGGVALCHATTGGVAALPGLLAHHLSGVPLLVTEYGVRLRTLYLDGTRHLDEDEATTARTLGAPVRAVLGGFHRALAADVYRAASLITPGNAHARRWQERCGADPAKLRTVYPGMDAERFARVRPADAGPVRGGGPAPVRTAGAGHSREAAPAGPDAGRAEAVEVRIAYVPGEVEPLAPRGRGRPVAGERREPVLGRAFARADRADAVPRPVPPEDGSGWDLVWVGRIEPAKDLHTLLRAFTSVHEAEPRATLRLVGTADDEAARAYLDSCHALTAALFPADPAGRPCPVRFDIGGHAREAGPDLAEVYAAADAVVLSSTAEGFPMSLVEAMFCARATVSTDVGAVLEVVGGTGVVVPPGDPAALAAACLGLLRDPGHRALLGAAARARALELFTVEQNIAAFRAIYEDLTAPRPVPSGRRPAETPVLVPGARTPSWSARDLPTTERAMETSR